MTRIETHIDRYYQARTITLHGMYPEPALDLLAQLGPAGREVTNEAAGVGSLLLGEPLTYLVMTRDDLEERAPRIVDLYENLMTALVRELYDGDLYPLPGSRGINLNYLPPGQGMEWHQDGADVAITSSLAVQDGGANLRFFEPETGTIVNVPPRRGVISFLPGRFLHRVEASSLPRVTLIQAWTTAAHESLVSRNEEERSSRDRYLYG